MIVKKMKKKNTTKIRHKPSNSMRIRTSRNRNNKYISHTLFKSPSHNLNGIQIHNIILREKIHCSQVSNGNKNRLGHVSFYQSNIERLLHLNPADCKNELHRLKLTQIKAQTKNW